MELLRDAKTKMLSGKFDLMIIEVQIGMRSKFGGRLPDRALLLRTNSSLDFAARETKKALHALVDFAAQMHISLHLWVSTDEHPDSPNHAIEAAISLSAHNSQLGGMVSWEGADGDDLWNRPQFWKMAKKLNSSESSSLMTLEN